MPKLVPFEDFVHRSTAVHGDRYDYALARAAWVDTKHKVPIICLVHGTFVQIPHNHLKGSGCPRCGDQRAGAAVRIAPAEIAARLHARYPHYALDLSSYRRTDVPATWLCTIHNQRFRCAFIHLMSDGARGCPACRDGAKERQRAAQRRDPQAEANLARVSEVLGPAFAELYRRWLVGETLFQIAQDQGVTREGARQRLLRVQALLQDQAIG